MSILEERGDLFVGEASNATANASDEEGQFGMLLGKGDELIDIGTDGFHAALHRGYAIALALQADALTPDSTKLSPSEQGRTTTVCSLQVAAKHKNLILFQVRNTLWRHSFLIHIRVHL